MSGKDFSPKGWLGTGICPRVSREVVTAPSLSEFKKHLDGALKCVSWGDLHRNEELDSMIFVDPFQFIIIYDSDILCDLTYQIPKTKSILDNIQHEYIFGIFRK